MSFNEEKQSASKKTDEIGPHNYDNDNNDKNIYDINSDNKRNNCDEHKNQRERDTFTPESEYWTTNSSSSSSSLVGDSDVNIETDSENVTSSADTNLEHDIEIAVPSTPTINQPELVQPDDASADAQDSSDTSSNVDSTDSLTLTGQQKQTTQLTRSELNDRVKINSDEAEDQSWIPRRAATTSSARNLRPSFNQRCIASGERVLQTSNSATCIPRTSITPSSSASIHTMSMRPLATSPRRTTSVRPSHLRLHLTSAISSWLVFSQL